VAGKVTVKVSGTGVSREASPPAAALRSMSLSNTVSHGGVEGGEGGWGEGDWEEEVSAPLALADESGQGGEGGGEEGDWEALAD
jgi:hypothetical protein